MVYFRAATTSTTTTTPAVSTTLTFRQLEESINKWSVDLDEQEKSFLNQASSVAAWDRLLVSNGEKVLQYFILKLEFEKNEFIYSSFVDCGS